MLQITTGTEFFKDFIDKHFYYVDKTALIEDILKNEVVLYSRPRGFGKTLNMSMLYYFFSNKEKKNAYLFHDLYISRCKQALSCQNQYPVISLTLKGMKAILFDDACDFYRGIISDILNKHQELLISSCLNETMVQELQRLSNKTASYSELENALYTISQALYLHYQQKVILLIDEYDVPLQAAYTHHYYEKMSAFISNIFSNVLKTNNALEKGVLTGCLRIAKESIFTGLNNFKVRSMTDEEACDCFGFTQNEITALLDYYHLSEKEAAIKEWYDGYNFSGTEIYNPWSCLMYVDKLIKNRNFEPTSFWANTSSNEIIKQYIENGNSKMHNEFEQLINGNCIYKVLKPELTYREMNFQSKEAMNDDIYSFLLYTGYLRLTGQRKKENDMIYEGLVIPNKEVKMIYQMQFMEWFNRIKKRKQNDFIDRLLHDDIKEAQKILNEVLKSSISYFDNAESFYHGFMVGFLKAEGYHVQSNKESGEGRFDLAVLPDEIDETAFIIECKHSETKGALRDDSSKAALQIVNKHYHEFLRTEGYVNYQSYGIAFYKKQCYITKA